MESTKSVITGTGAYIPPVVKTNADFTMHNFYAEDNQRIDTDPAEIVRKFEQITGIAERRYASADMDSSDMRLLLRELLLKMQIVILKQLTRSLLPIILVTW